MDAFAFVVPRLLVGALVGASIGLTGVGGGVLVMPALIVLLGLPPSVAVGTASLYAFLTKAYASIAHWRLNTVHAHAALWVLAGAVPGNVVAALMVTVKAQGAAAGPFQRGLRTFIACAILLSATALITNLAAKRRATGGAADESEEPIRAHWTLAHKAAAVVGGVVVGSLIGSTSVGGGVLTIPLLIVVLRLPACRTVGTSIVIAAVLTLLTTIVYASGRQADVLTASTMAVGSLVGVLGGTRLCVRMQDSALQAVIILVVLVAALAMIV